MTRAREVDSATCWGRHLAAAADSIFLEKFGSGPRRSLRRSAERPARAAWAALRPQFALAPLVLGLAVLIWVAGFDIIYATQDLEADRREGLHSLVVWLGIPHALVLAGVLHLILLIALVGFGLSAHLGAIYFLGLLPIPFLLVYEHHIARSLDVALINKAFFETNAIVGLLFVVVTTMDRVFA